MRGHRLTSEEVIRRAEIIHKGKYDYSKLVYIKATEKICIICPIHGEFWQYANNHLHGAGCPGCKGSKISEVLQAPFTTEVFIERARKIHGDKYDYSKVKYVRSCIKVSIGCPIHGEFFQTPNIHLKGHGCKKCGAEYRANTYYRLTTSEFIMRARRKHGDRFDYSRVEYVDTHTPVEIICPKGHITQQKPCDHLHGSGCPICRESKGEAIISSYLDEHGYSYIREYKIKPQQRLFGRRYFRVDFYLPDKNVMIEYHGEQHFKPVKLWDFSENKLQEQQDRDIRLREYCKQNKIKLIEIHYSQRKNISQILNRKIK